MAGRLTPNEKTAITAAANKAAKFLTGKKSPPEALDTVFSVVAGLKGSKTSPIIGKEAIALWGAKIDYAIANGDALTLSKLTKVPADTESFINRVRAGGTTAFWDSNGGCNCGGGGGTSGW